MKENIARIRRDILDALDVMNCSTETPLTSVKILAESQLRILELIEHHFPAGWAQREGRHG